MANQSAIDARTSSASTTSTNNRKPLRVALLWTTETMTGPAAAVVDVIRSLHTLSKMRSPDPTPRVVWRWVSPPGQHRVDLLDARHDETYQSFRGMADLWVLPGWMANSGPHMDQLIRLAKPMLVPYKKAMSLGAHSVAVGNGSVFAAASGLLAGQSTAVHWAFVPSLLRQCTSVQLVNDQAMAHSKQFWSCAAPVSATELFLQALMNTCAAELASAVAPLLLHTPERQSVAQKIVQDAHQRQVPSGCVARAKHWMQDNLTEPFDVDRLAEAAATSPRSLQRHFLSAEGQTPWQYVCELRITRAKVLLETTYLPVEQVAQACGYIDPGTFRRIFKKFTQKLPAAYREAHRLRTSRPHWST
jgi:transcriptional regulator GlxA family with amidase domain